MVKKNFTKSGKHCRVTFKLPKEIKAQKAALCAEFNGWDPNAHLMRRLKGGGFSTTISLQTGKSYRFRYFLDNHRWENDGQADTYTPNVFGSEDSVVQL